MKTERRRSFPPDIYGQFIVDFVNAETIMTAYCVLFDNIYKLFETDPWFLSEVNRIKELYDKFLSEFNEIERRVVAFKMREAEALLVLHEANDLIQNTILAAGTSSEEESKEIKRKYLMFKDFDAPKKALVFVLAPTELGLPGEILPEPDKVLIDFFDKRLNPRYLLEYKELINVHAEMEKIKNQIASDRLRYISQKTMDELNYSIDREGNLSMIRGVLRHFLEELALTDDLRETSLIGTILIAYNEKPRYYYLDYEDGILKQRLSFDEYAFSEWIGDMVMRALCLHMII